MGTLETLTHFGDAVVAPIGPTDRQYDVSPIEIKTSYINNLRLPITVALRSGLKFILQPQYSLTNAALTVRVQLTITSSTRHDIQKILSAVDATSSKELQVMKEAFTTQVERNYHNSAIIYIDYPIKMDTLKSFGGSIYFHELDTVFSLEGYENAPAHPFSELGRALTLNADKEKASSFNYSIDIVDNLGEYGPRYLNIGKKVYKVKPLKDSNRANGIYILGDNPVISAIESNATNVTFLPLGKDIDIELGLYRSYEDALNAIDDRAEERKLKIASLEHEASIAKRNSVVSSGELQQIKHQYELLEIERNKELAILTREREKHAVELQELRDRSAHELKMEMEKLKMASEEKKDHYEERSHQRKDSSEVLKFIPSVVVGLGALFLALKTLG